MLGGVEEKEYILRALRRLDIRYHDDDLSVKGVPNMLKAF